MYRSNGARESPAPQAEEAKADGRTGLGVKGKRGQLGAVSDFGFSPPFLSRQKSP